MLGEHLLQDGILHMVFRFRQLSKIALESWNLCKQKTFRERLGTKGHTNLRKIYFPRNINF